MPRAAFGPPHVLALALAGVLAVRAAAGGEAKAPLRLRVEAATLYDAGVQQGREAAAQIREWVDSDEVRAVRQFVAGEGQGAFRQLQMDSTRAYPQYAEEIRGIADGAKLPVDAVWSINLLSELELLMDQRPPISKGHCSDLYAVSPGGPAAGFSHGHNEDWPGLVSALWYFVELVPLPGADFDACAGMAYPGNVLGFAVTWNAHGMYLTQNSLFPKTTKPGGIASIFAQRHALCGPSGRRGLDGVVASLNGTSWSAGASVNLVDLPARRMANVEMYESRQKVTEVTESMGNYSHFNMYKALGAGVLDTPEPSSVHRQARVDALPAMRSRADIVARLSDTADPAYPLFRNMTLATFVLDGRSGQLEVWCCGSSAAGDAPPIHRWNISAATEQHAQLAPPRVATPRVHLVLRIRKA